MNNNNDRKEDDQVKIQVRLDDQEPNINPSGFNTFDFLNQINDNFDQKPESPTGNLKQKNK